MVKVQELGDYLAVLQFFVVDLAKGFESELCMGDVVDVKRLHDKACDLVHGVGFADETSCLLHLLGAQFRLEANVGDPMSLLEAHSWELLALAIVEFTKQSFLYLVDVLDFHVR